MIDFAGMLKGLIPLALLLLSAQAIDGQQALELPADVQQIIDDFSGEIYFSAKNLKTGNVIEYRAGRKVQTASVIKVPIMVEVFAQARDNRLGLDDRLVLNQENRVPGAGILQDLGLGLQLKIRDLLVLMIVLSDNTATNMLIDEVGIEPVNRRMKEMGIENTVLYKKVFLPAPARLSQEQGRWGLGSTTPREMLALMEKIYRGEAVTPADSHEMISILKKQRDRDQIPRYLAGEEWSGVEVAHKTGALNELRNDVGIVFTPDGEFILSLFAQESQDQKWTPDNAASLVLGRLAEALVREFRLEK